MLNTKVISSGEKVFLDNTIDIFERLDKISALRGERLSFQLIGQSSSDRAGFHYYKLSVSGELAPYTTVRAVDCLPVTNPVNTQDFSPYDDNYLRTAPGLYPDLLTPLTKGDTVFFSHKQLHALWVDVCIPEDCAILGADTLTFSFTDHKDGCVYSDSVEIKVIAATLPEQELKLTQWFHCDSLATYYGVPVWSEEHWRIIENFARVAYKNGINLLLTPVFTPPLDTEIGKERPTVQLVDVTVRNGKYYFGFDKLTKWIEMAERCGIRYFEMSHLYTQ
jgi:hypothetical protein